MSYRRISLINYETKDLLRSNMRIISKCTIPHLNTTEDDLNEDSNV